MRLSTPCKNLMCNYLLKTKQKKNGKYAPFVEVFMPQGSIFKYKGPVFLSNKVASRGFCSFKLHLTEHRLDRYEIWCEADNHKYMRYTYVCRKAVIDTNIKFS